jgi:hypothetical protein
VFDLSTALNAFVANVESNGVDFQTDRDLGVKMRAIVSASAKAVDNDFTKRLRRSIEAIEELLKPHLGRKE